MNTQHAALCTERQGWGPVSLVQYAFTPCFQESVILSLPNVLLAILGPFTLSTLWRQKKRIRRRGWHYGLKVFWLVWILLVAVLLAGLDLLEDDSLQDARFWAAIVQVIAVVFMMALQHVAHVKTMRSSDLILGYWLLEIIVDLVRLQGFYVGELVHFNLPKVIIFAVGLVAKVGLLGTEWLGQMVANRYISLSDDEDEKECPLRFADLFSRLTFSWMTPLMRTGYANFLTEHDLFNLRTTDRANVLGDSFNRAWSRQMKKKNGPSVWLALFRAYGMPYLTAAFFKAGQDMLAFLQPQLLRKLISFVSAYQLDESRLPIQGFSIAGAMFAVSLLQTLCLHQYFQRSFEVGMRTKAGLTAVIYKKSLALSNDGRESKSTGDIVNLMSVDTQRMQDLCGYGQIVWSAPFQIIICLLSLYSLLGWSMVAGVAVMIVMVPINGLLARWLKTFQRRQMRNKDQRTRLISEILNNIKSIKLYAWEPAFMAKLRHVRNDLELKTLRKIGMLNATAQFTWSCAPFFVSCSTFAVFVLVQKQPLTTDIVFPSTGFI